MSRLLTLTVVLALSSVVWADYNFNSSAGYEVDPSLTSGHVWGWASGENAVPVGAWANVTIFEPGHPEWLPDWRVDFGSHWLVTSDFTLLPEPASAILMALGSILFRRRA